MFGFKNPDLKLLTSKEVRETSPGWKVLAYYWSKTAHFKFRFFSYLFSMSLKICLTAIIAPLMFKYLVDAFLNNPSSSFNYLIIIVICSIVGVLCRLFSDWQISHLNPFLTSQIENDCFTHLHKRSYSFFSDQQIGGLVAKVKRFAESYDHVSFHLTNGFFGTFIQFTASLIVSFFFSKYLALAFLIWSLFFSVISYFLLIWKMRLDKLRAEEDSVVTSRLADSLTNFLTIKLFSVFDIENQYFQDSTEKKARLMCYSWLASTTMNLTQGVLVSLLEIFILYWSFLKWQSGEFSVGTIVMLQTYVVQNSMLLMELGTHMKGLFRHLVSGFEMIEILNQPVEVQDPEIPVAPTAPTGKIEIRNISFSYRPEIPLFQNFNLTIRPNEKIGLVGPSGSGKSTLIKLILRCMDVQDGSIIIDGQDIRLLKQDDLHSKISIVPQDTILFHRSIGSNIAIGNQTATEKDIEATCTKSYLDELIERLPQGLDTMVGERGIKLSGGERQRLAIARAIIKHAPILILDEATSSLDTLSENYIQQALGELLLNQTSIVIAHRLSTVQKLDRIIVLDRFKIIQEGTHAELVDCDGLYKKLWEQQRSFIA